MCNRILWNDGATIAIFVLSCDAWNAARESRATMIWQMTSEHHTKIEENWCFRVIFGALGSLGGPLGGAWSHLVPRVFSEPENMVRWTPCGLPWRTLKSIENHSCWSMLALLFKKVCPKTGPQARSLFIKVLCNFGDPATLFFELSPAREHDSPKMAWSLKVAKKHPKVRQNGSPKLPILSPRVNKCDLLVNKMQTKQIQQKSDQKSHAGYAGYARRGGGGPL